MSRDERGHSDSGQRAFSTLHALALVARRRGLELTFEELRRSYVFSEAEPSSDAVLAMARDFGLEGKRLKLRWNDLSRLRSTLPAILRLKDGSSLVLEGFRKESGSGPIAILRDPTVASDALMAVDETQLGE